MRENCAFASLSHAAVGNDGQPNLGEEALRGLEFLGHSIDQSVYWNKECTSAGLLCGSSVTCINSVTRCLVGAHLEQEPATQVRPRVLAFHVGHHMLPEAYPEILHGKRATVLVSPRMMQSSGTQGSTQPLRLREQDVSLHHVLAFFTPPPYMHAATASKILTTIQYVVSQLPPEDPFDLQAFIQLVEQEKWDDEGSTFVALRQTLLTGLLSGHQDDVPLHRLNHVLLDLTDPILCDTQVENVMMDIALHAFLNTSTDQKEMTLIILSSAHEYLRDSSPLLRTLESLILQRDHGISVLITTTNLSSLALPPGIFNTLDYIGLTGPLRSSVWLATLKANWDPIKLADAPLSFFARDTLAIISPDSLLMGIEEDRKGREAWGDIMRTLDIKEMAQYASQKILLVDSQVTGDEAPSSEGSYTAASGLQELSARSQSHRETEMNRGIYYRATPSTPVPSTRREYQLSQVDLTPAQEGDLFWGQTPAVDSPALQAAPVIAIANDLYSDDSSDDDYPRNSQPVTVAPPAEVILNRKFAGTYVPAFFSIATDLPPHAFTRTIVQAGMYPADFQLLALTMLSLSGGYSNTYVAKTVITSRINSILGARKALQSPLRFKSYKKMAKSAWSANIIRFSVEDKGQRVYLVNPPSVVDALNLQFATAPKLAHSRGACAIEVVTQNARKTSPFLHLVNTIARSGGGYAGVQVLARRTRKELGHISVVQGIGFPKAADYFKEAVRLGIVAMHGSGKGKTISLQADFDHLQSLLVRPSANV